MKPPARPTTGGFHFPLMRSPAFILPLIAAAFAAAAETKPALPAAPAAEEINPREAALDRLLSERDSEENFQLAIAQARTAGINEQAILEARFVFHVDRQEDDALANLLPDFLKRNEDFKIEDSEIFATKEDWLAVVEYLKAIAALKANDKDAFKKHITEAFWLSPKQGTAFAPHIERMRLRETMAAVKIDFNDAFAPVAGGDPIALSKVIGRNKALLIQFWSPWSPECEAALPDFTSIAGELIKNDIAVATIILESSPKSLSDTQAIIRPMSSKPLGTWLVDRDRDALSPTLRVQNVPMMVLVSTSGQILSNSPASSDELWDALKKINPSITKPKLTSQPEGR